MTYLLDTDTCIYWLRNRQSVRKRVKEVGWDQIDLLIASVALAGGYILVTNNTRHYERITGLQLQNWTIQT